MKTLTATNARGRWFELIKDSALGHKIFRIASKDGGVVLLSENDYESLLETLELLSTPGMLKSIKQSKKEIKQGKTYSMKEVFGD